MKKAKMNTKNLMVSFVTIMALILVATSVSADGLNIDRVTVDGQTAYTSTDAISVTAGETATIKVYLIATDNTPDSEDYKLPEVVIKAEVDGNEIESKEFNVVARYDKVHSLAGTNSYIEPLNIKIPYDFDDDELYKNLKLEITVESDSDEVISEVYTLEVQRPSYNVDFKLPISSKTVEAGETLPIDILVKNIGFNNLDDLYVTAKIPTLGVEEKSYLGDLVNAKEDSDSDDDDDTDTMNKRMYLKVPYGTVAGTYALEVEVSNEDAIISKTVQFVVTNSLPETVIKSGNDLIVVNPTNKVAVYRVVYNEKEIVESVNAGQSIKVPIEVPEGEYSFDVNVFSVTGDVVGTVNYSGKGAEASTVANFESPVVILTVVLAIIFLVLLVVLIVLVTKKPEKAEEFGESYY